MAKIGGNFAILQPSCSGGAPLSKVMFVCLTFLRHPPSVSLMSQPSARDQQTLVDWPFRRETFVFCGNQPLVICQVDSGVDIRCNLFSCTADSPVDV